MCVCVVCVVCVLCVCVLRTTTGRSNSRLPHSIIPTDPDAGSIECVSSVTGVGSNAHEGGNGPFHW